MISLNEYNQIFNANINLIKQRRRITDSRVLFESVQNRKLDSYDVFISYSSNDKERAIFVKELLELNGFNVYIDLEDNVLNPKNVNIETAKRLEKIISKSKSILYIHSQNSERSVWCPWELGYGDGINSKISVLEIYVDKTSYKQVYINMYNCFEIKKCKDGKYRCFVFNRENQKEYVSFDDYINGNYSWRMLK